MAVLTINSNIASLSAQRRLAQSSSDLAGSLERLASGFRINRASDDAAGLSISSILKSRARVYAQAIRNANDGISSISIAEGATKELSSILIRLKELAESAANGTYNRAQRLGSDTEALALTDEYNRIVGTTSFNGRSLLDGTLPSLTIQLGYGTNERLTFGMGQGLSRTVSSGTYTETQNAGPATGANGAATGDLNGDGRADIVFQALDGSGLYAQISNASGVGGTPTQVSATYSAGVALGDVNGDGKLDILTKSTTQLGVMLGNGDGTFGTATNYTVAGDSIALGDLNGDGRPDIAISDSGSSTLRYLMNTGSGSFGSTQSLNLGSAALNASTVIQNVSIADFNGDGNMDIVVSAANGINMFQGSGSGTFSGRINAYNITEGSAMAAADFNHDGIADLAVINNSGIDILAGRSNGTFALSASFAGSYNDLKVGDFNGDGYTDFAAVYLPNGGPYPINSFINNGAGTFTAHDVGTNTSAPDNTPYVLAAADFNGDGVIDLAGLTSGSPGCNNFTEISNTQNSNYIQRIDLSSQQSARSALDIIETLFGRVTQELGNMGSSQSRLNTAISNLGSARLNYAAANGRIEDADIASESASLTANTIRQQVSSAVLAQANQQPTLLLDILKASSR